MRRSDYEICRAIYRVSGQDALRQYIALPYVELESPPENLREMTKEEQVELLTHLPFDEAHYAFVCKEENPLHVVTILPGPFEGQIMSSVTWVDNDGLKARAVIFDLAVEGPRLAIRPPDANHHPDDMKIVAGKTLAVLQRMKELGDQRPVEIRPPETTLEERRRHPKPDGWLSDLPRVVMLDQAQALKVGQRVDHGGSHASPIAHNRRGCYITLRAERYGDNRGKRVWRRPTWVGDRKWMWSGSTYRVLKVRGDDDV